MANPNTTTSNYSILSNREKFDDKQKQIIDNVKLALFESLDIDSKLVNRDTISQEIEDLRGVDGKDDISEKRLNIKEKYVRIKKSDNSRIHKDIFDEYKKLQAETPIDNAKLSQLDNKLAERLILDNKLAIEFKDGDNSELGKNAEEISKSSYEGLNSLTRYQHRIELISKNPTKMDCFIIKWTPKELEKIRGAEEAIKLIEKEGLKEAGDSKEEEGSKETEKKDDGGQTERIKNLEDQIKELTNKLNDITNNKDAKDVDENKKEKTKEGVEKANEIEWDLENKDINYKKSLKKRVEENLRVGGTLILNKGSSQIAVLEKKDNDGFICHNQTDSELEKLIDLDPKHHVFDDEGNISYQSYITNEDLWNFINFKEEIKPDPIKPDPIKPDPIPDYKKDLELDAVISDMGTDVHRERVSLETEEELRAEYKKTGVWNVPKKLALFLWRGNRRKKLIKKKMDALSGKAFSGIQGLDEEMSDSSDRHELELKKHLSEVDTVKDASNNVVKVNNPLVNNLCKDYLNGILNESEFQTQFNDIVEKDNYIQSLLRGEKITHIGTNILLKLKQQKSKMDLSNKVDIELNQYFSTKNQIHINNINTAIEDYIRTYQTNPDFMKDYEKFIDSGTSASDKIEAKNSLDIYFKHQASTMKMQIENVKMNMNILVKGKSAYQIDNKDRQKGWMYKLGNKLDKLPRWVQTAGFIGVSVGTGLLTGGLGTFAAAAITTGVTASSVGTLNAIKKRTHHTKEQNTHEKNVVTDNKNEQARVGERQNQALNGKWYERKTYKAKRQLALYNQTTQENIQISDTISNAITDLSLKVGKLEPKEENYMKKNLIEGWARLKYYRETGHNFLASNDKGKIEKDMRRLEKSLILGSDKLGKTLNDIEAMEARDDMGGNITYDIIQKDLRNSYDKSLIQFKRERRNLAIKYGVGTAALSAGMSLGMQYVLGTGVFAEGKEGVSGTTFTEGTKENFALGKHNLLDNGTQNNIYNTGSDMLKDPRLVSGSEIKIIFGAGTDATQVIQGHLTPGDYATKLTEVASNIKSMGLSPTMEKQFVDLINSEPWKAGWSADFTNDALHGMRSAEFIEHTARAFADSGRTDLVLKFAYDSSLDVVGNNIDNVAERVVNATYNISTPDIPGAPAVNHRSRMLFAPLFFNTFKDRVKGKKEEDKTIPKEEPTTPKKDKEYPISPDDSNIPKTPILNPPITDRPGWRRKQREDNGENPFKDDDFEPITPKPFDKGVKIGVTPRATFFDKLDINPKNLGKEYPSNFKFKTDDEIADIIIDSKVPLYKDANFQGLYNDTLKIESAIIKGDRQTAKNILIESLKKERSFINKERTIYNKSIDIAFDVINKRFTETGGDRSLLPDKSKVHVVGSYEFRGQKGGYKKNVLGFCSYMNGELFINRDALYYSSSSDEDRSKRLIHTIVHEMIHGTSTANYRHQYKDETKLGREDSNNRYPNARRLGAQLRRFTKKVDGSIKIQERGRALNEAITEHLARDILSKDLNFDAPSNCYPKEREILDSLCRVYNIEPEEFYKVLINRKTSLKNINEKLSTRIVFGKKLETPSFYTLLMSIMDYEYDQEYNKKQPNSYKLTKALINGEQLVITPEMKEYFHPGLLKDGLLKLELQESYPNLLDQQVKSAVA